MQTLPTNKGNLSIDQILDNLMWGCYVSNRDAGSSHEILIKWGIGNEDMKNKYEQLKSKR